MPPDFDLLERLAQKNDPLDVDFWSGLFVLFWVACVVYAVAASAVWWVWVLLVTVGIIWVALMVIILALRKANGK